MSNFIVSTIRTLVPIALGGAATWVARKTGFILNEDIEAQAAVIVTGGVIAAYYVLVHALEQRWPKIGLLLGRDTLPYYDGGPT